jgi:NAD(P)-dependent dehydrogenase (short-subunit alcohol dehydrogenase family)
MPTDHRTQRLAGKKILITAGASGMGRAGAELFAEHGAAVCIADYNETAAKEVVEAINGKGGRAFSLFADLTDMDTSRRIVHEAAERLDGLDSFWAHAGSPGPENVAGIDWEAYRRAMALNLDSVVASIGEAIPYLKKGGGQSSILVTASIAGLVGSPFSPTYSLAKFGVIGLAKSLALALGPDNIRVNALCPGVVDTPMLPVFMSRSGDAQVQQESRTKFEAAVPLGRVAQPIEQAHAALWLLSDDASYVTGVALPVDGGYTAK